MKFTQEFTDREAVQQTANFLHKEVDSSRTYHFMEFCGGHTHVLFRYGLLDLIPKNIKMIHGPGCPVCVLPMSRIDGILKLLTQHPEVYLFTYADLIRVPGSSGKNLMKAKAEGSKIKMTYSATEALMFAKQNPDKQVVFLAVGFETTTPPTAQVILKAKEWDLKNFSVCCYHVLTPPAIFHILGSSERGEEHVSLDGIVGPGHVSTITGSKIYEEVVREYQQPLVISGFYPLDMLQSLILLVRQVNENEAFLENQYARTVTREGNFKAQRMIESVLKIRESFEWRGLGSIPKSALCIREEFADYDAEKRFQIEPNLEAKDHPLCICGDILKGVKSPRDCKIFGKLCTPENPIGACMVSSEGACAAYYTYGQTRA
ncbi:MAG: hydrogenase formation protein HypD [Planctomycetota bacterium]